MAFLRTRAVNRLVLAVPGELGRLRLLPSELDPAAGEREPADLGPEYLRRVRDQPPDREDHLDAGRQALELQDGTGNRILVAARCAAPRRHAQPLRRWGTAPEAGPVNGQGSAHRPPGDDG